MLGSAVERILDTVAPDASVLDVGGWAKPLPRADWVIDLLPYETRGLYGYTDEARASERFTADTWVTTDICSSQPWPFENDRFDFVVCSHTLEDIRDPVRVCEELVRVSRAGYVEVPAPVEELTWGVHGAWVGWSHHRWIVELLDERLVFTHKPHQLCAEGKHLPAGTCDALAPEQRIVQLWWTGSFNFEERIFIGADEFHPWLAGLLGSAPTPSGTSRKKRLFGRGPKDS